MDRLNMDEPYEITRAPGGGYRAETGWTSYSMAASGAKGAKEKRRKRVELIYSCNLTHRLSEDEIDALAIAHDCAVALAYAASMQRA